MLLVGLNLLSLLVRPSVVASDIGLLRVVSLVRSQIDLLSSVVDLVVLDDFPYDLPDVFFVSHLLEKRGDSAQLSIRHVVVPTRARDRVLRLEHESNGRVVYDDHICHWPAKPGQILYERVVVVCTVLSKELVRAEAFWVQLST